MIYLDNAATTLKKPDCVKAAVAAAFDRMGNSGRGASEPSLDASRMIYEARERLTRLFNGENPAQLVFTANATQALNTAIKGLGLYEGHVITTVLEHNSVLRPLYECQRKGARLTIVGCDEKGNVDCGQIEAAVCPDTKAIVCTHASNLTGNMIDLEAVGDIAKKHGLLFIADASQSAGIFPIDVQKMHIDVLCFTGHKGLLGPQGTGGMYVRSGLVLDPLISGGSGVDTYNEKHPSAMPTALEAGTLNGHGIAGLCAALGYIENIGQETIRAREMALMRRFYEGVSNIPGVKIYGDFDAPMRAAIVTLNIRDYDSSEVSDVLSTEYGIVTRAGAHCAPLMHKALGTVSQGAVRFSFSHFNTEEEIDFAAEAIKKLASDT